MQEAERFKKILVAVDGSEQSMRAVDASISLAKRYNSVLTALYIIHIPFGESLYPRSVWYKEFIDDINEETRGWFADIRKRGSDNDVEIEVKMKETAESVPAEIVRFAKSGKTCLIIVGSRGKSQLETLLLGSVASGVLANAPCPVLVIR